MESVELRKLYAMNFSPPLLVLKHIENRMPHIKGLSAIWGLVKGLRLQLADLGRSSLSIIDVCSHFFFLRILLPLPILIPNLVFIRQGPELKSDCVKRNNHYKPLYSFCHLWKSVNVDSWSFALFTTFRFWGNCDIFCFPTCISVYFLLIELHLQYNRNKC
jgi:hypothetical protein